MRKFISFLAPVAVAAVTLSTPAQASLPVGAKAPAFVTKGAKGGQQVTFDLRQALKRGPVVLYFYPKAFTQGCTLEAHAFAEATDDFAKLHATVVGMSADDLPTLKKFSAEECRDKFAVGIATPRIVKDYDVAMTARKMPAPPAGTAGPPAGASAMPAGLTERVSYVIAPNGTITLVHAEMDYRGHVAATMEAVRKLAKKS